MFRKPTIFEKFNNLVAAESRRNGGVSPAPFHSLNLGGSTTDTEQNVMENNKRFFSALSIPFEHVAKSHQIHKTEVLTVTKPDRYYGYDALITNKKNIQLAVTIADCTPILIYDSKEKVVAAIHAGWRGTVGEIVTVTLAKMHTGFGTEAPNCYAYIGTCIDEHSFEVGMEVADQFDCQFKTWNSETQHFHVNLKRANQQLLLNAGVLPENIEVSNYSTFQDNDQYFSYRKENGVTGRMLATIGMIEY